MNNESKKRQGWPFALFLTGAAVGAYLVYRKQQAGESVGKSIDKVLGACDDSLKKLEQRITRAAS